MNNNFFFCQQIISIDVNSDIGSNYFIGKKIQKGKVYKSNVRLLNQG